MMGVLLLETVNFADIQLQIYETYWSWSQMWFIPLMVL